MRTAFRMLGCATLVIGLLGGCGDDLENMPTREAVLKTLSPGRDMGYTKVADLYGGKAVLSDNGATWWVRDGQVFVANGIAIALSPGYPKSPPSVTTERVNEAIAGKAFPLPPHLGMTPEELFRAVDGQLKTVAMPPLKASTNLNSTMSVGNQTVGQITLHEVGGYVTSATVEVLYGATKDSPERRPGVALLATALRTALDNPGSDDLDGLIRTTLAGNEERVSVGSRALLIRRDKGANLVEVTVVPAGQK